MSKEAEPGKVKTDETHSDVIELSTFSNSPHQEIVLRPPPQFSEDFNSYISKQEREMYRPSTSKLPSDGDPNTSKQSPTFHRYSTVEISEVIEYENFTHGRTPSLVDVEQPLSGNGTDLADGIMSLRTRLKMKKQRLPFIAYAVYAMEAIYLEVEKILILNIIFLIFSVGVAALGMKRVASCPYLPTIPVTIVVSGVIDAFVNILSIIFLLTKRSSLKEALLDITRMGRLTLFFIHIYGLVKVYSILPPEESDHTSQTYCEPQLYWTTFAFFHITTLSSIVVVVGMVTAIASFNE